MPFLFKTHYTREEARALLPQVRDWLRQLKQLRPLLQHDEESLAPRLKAGEDLGGALGSAWTKHIAEARFILREFQKREIQIKDLDRGLIDFPGFVAGKEVFLCWEEGEEDVEFWHDLNSGYAGRERL